MSNRDFIIERLSRKSDLSSLPELALTCFRMHVDTAYFQWKYFDNPAGEAVYYIARSGEKIVATFGAIPETYFVDGVKKTIYQTVDAMTHPDARRHGLFVRLASLCFEEIDRLQPDSISTGFPSILSFPGFTGKLGFDAPFQFKLLFTHSLYLKISRSLRKKGTLQFQNIDRMTPQLSDYLNSIAPSARIQKEMNSAVFEWKVFRNPSKQIRVIGCLDGNDLVGYVLYYEDSPRSCYLLDLHFSEGYFHSGAVRQTIDHLLHSTQKKWVYCWENHSNNRKKTILRSGFFINPFSFGKFHASYLFVVRYGEKASAEPWKSIRSYDLNGIMLD